MDWLLLLETGLNDGIESIKSRLIALLDQETTDRIAHALGEMKHLYKKDEQQTDDIEEAIAPGGLVLITTGGKAY